ncbi:MAG: glycosyltransferase 87 family protein [Propionicimonas sp.]|uniref:glycosyltransferase 87 family protein n=1 Tax=Propionicimonas sp. TaxID=1955623 RepID=UPI002B1FD547|nr:glycosyltransferase 87 family protein [Propionicimonas sp.]MEA4944724.1 glycosyltransferase 87 family protein [Propionicimonas sp.]MEA5053215.1 glycosyltransferase 87 family protein [Propionicimonas sp.]MEA5117317.1 glycosyltransferase 87 family protein [Propionicimonas sp.]
MDTRGWKGRLSLVGLVLLPLLAACYVAGTQITGSVLWPWHPGMIDLEVYQRTGTMLLAGQDFFTADGLPWIYPPFAALLTVPWAVLPFEVAAVTWLALNVAALAAVLYRLGFSGWMLSVATTVCVLFVEPVAETLGFGNLGILLVAAVVVDSMPGQRLLRRRILPEGWLTGVATAVKLTPAVVAAHNFFAGRRRPGLVAFFAFAAATLVGFVTLWQASLHYWGGLLTGDTGINSGIVYATNQSVLGVWNRLFGEASRGGLAVSLLVVVCGLVVSVSLHRASEQQLALCIAGLTSLLASPISWSHHYVWIVPLGIVLWQRRHLPPWLRWFGLAYVAWGVVAPFKWLPRGDNVELRYSVLQQVVVNIGVVAGLVLLGLCLAAARQLRRTPRIAARL